MTRRRRARQETGDIAVTNGREPLGRVVYLGSDWRAELADGRVLGTYESLGEAREAIGEAIRAGRTA